MKRKYFRENRSVFFVQKEQLLHEGGGIKTGKEPADSSLPFSVPSVLAEHNKIPYLIKYNWGLFMTKKILIIGIFLVAAVLLLFYWVLSSKSKEVSALSPFSSWIGKPVILQRPMIVVQVSEMERTQEDYTLLEVTHPALDQYKQIDSLPPGSVITFDKALLVKAAVSGSSTIYMIGRIKDPRQGNEYPFAYSWGEFHFLFQENPYWTFPIAPWQLSADTTHYHLPEIPSF